MAGRLASCEIMARIAPRHREHAHFRPAPRGRRARLILRYRIILPTAGWHNRLGSRVVFLATSRLECGYIPCSEPSLSPRGRGRTRLPVDGIVSDRFPSSGAASRGRLCRCRQSLSVYPASHSRWPAGTAPPHHRPSSLAGTPAAPTRIPSLSRTAASTWAMMSPVVRASGWTAPAGSKPCPWYLSRTPIREGQVARLFLTPPAAATPDDQSTATRPIRSSATLIALLAACSDSTGPPHQPNRRAVHDHRSLRGSHPAASAVVTAFDRRPPGGRA